MDSDKKSCFKEAMKHVKPLRPSKKMPTIKPEKNPTYQKPQKTAVFNFNNPKPIQAALSNPWDTSTIQPDTCLIFGEKNIQSKQFKQLKQGSIRPEARLDLHGAYLEEASDALLQFIHNAYNNNMRCVLVIHGKGGRFHGPPVLKTHVNHWLKQLSEVLTFHSAMPRDGGHGAVYVLLKQK
jgi:DNA-nicking Smr family endonuclease